MWHVYEGWKNLVGWVRLKQVSQAGGVSREGG